MGKKIGLAASSADKTERHRPGKRARIYLVAAVLAIIFLPSFIKYQELSYKNRKMEEKINILRGENRKLEEEKRRLQTDIAYIEKRAREEIGLARKGEIVLKKTQGKK